jgi:hypothetical protein
MQEAQHDFKVWAASHARPRRHALTKGLINGNPFAHVQHFRAPSHVLVVWTDPNHELLEQFDLSCCASPRPPRTLASPLRSIVLVPPILLLTVTREAPVRLFPA